MNDTYRAVDDPARLLAPERDPRTGRRVTPRRARDGKRREERARRIRPRRSPAMLAAFVAGAAVLLGGGIGAAVAISGGSSGDDAGPTTTIATAPADPSKAAKGEVLVEFTGLTATSDVYDPPDTPKAPLLALPLFCSNAHGCRFNSLVARDGRIRGTDTTVKDRCGSAIRQTVDVRLSGSTTVEGVRVPARAVGSFRGSVARTGDQCSGREVVATVDAHPG